MLTVLLTITLILGVVLIMLLLFVLGKLNWLETATISLLSRLEAAAASDRGNFKNGPLGDDADPYFYGIDGHDLWQSLTGQDKTLATALELDEIRPRYAMALLKATTKFVQDGIDLENGINVDTISLSNSREVFTTRGKIKIWLPPSRSDALRVSGSKIARFSRSSHSNEESDDKKVTDETIQDELISEVLDLCNEVELSNGSEVAKDLVNTFFPSHSTESPS
jgi:hypothetical protein